MEYFLYNKRKIVIVGILILVFIIGVSLFFIIRETLYSVTLSVTVAPSIAKVRIGNEEFSSLGEYRIRPGEYEVEISAEGFISKKGTLTAVANETINFAEYLEPTEENNSWYNDHPEDRFISSEIASDMAIQKYYELQEIEPILNYVPYNTFTYSINYENDCDENGGGLCLVLSGEMGPRNTMIEYLQKNGENLSRYKVKIKDYEDPFGKAKLDVPGGLEYNGGSNRMDLAIEIEDIKSLVGEFIRMHFKNNNYDTEILQIKRLDEYCVIKVKVYQKQSDGKVFDTYRLIVGKIDGKWRVLTNLDWILTRYDNPNIPIELLGAANDI